MRLDDHQWAGLLLFAGCAEFAIGMTVAEAIDPGYSISRNFISDLGIGPAAIVFNPSIILLGAAILLAAIFLLHGFRDRIYAIVVAIAGIGAIGVGVFTEDFQVVHGLASLVTFVFSGLAAVLAFRIVRPPFAYLSLLIGITSLAALGLYVSETFLNLGPGGMERMIVWPVLIWGATFGGFLMSAGTVEAPSPPP